MATNKVVYGNRTLIDLTQDTIIADALLAGYTAHGANGEEINGTITAMTHAEIDEIMEA